jgi:hypothetical protein
MNSCLLTTVDVLVNSTAIGEVERAISLKMSVKTPLASLSLSHSEGILDVEQSGEG